MNARDTTKVYIWRLDTGWGPILYRKCHSHNTPGKRHNTTRVEPLAGNCTTSSTPQREQVWQKCKIQKNWCTVTVAPTIEHHGGHSRTPVNQRCDQVPGRSNVSSQLLLINWEPQSDKRGQSCQHSSFVVLREALSKYTWNFCLNTCLNQKRFIQSVYLWAGPCEKGVYVWLFWHNVSKWRRQQYMTSHFGMSNIRHRHSSKIPWHLFSKV